MSTRTLMKSGRRAAVLMMALVLMLMAVPQSAQAAFRIHIPSVSNARVAGFQPFVEIQACNEAESLEEAVDLVAGQNLVIGYVAVYNGPEKADGSTTVTVTYKIEEPNWYLDETHLHIGKSLDDIPRNKAGNPKIGNFDYSTSHGGDDLQEYSYVVEVTLSGDIVIAAHAAVVKKVNGVIVQEETAWGDGLTIGKQWAMYFRYTIETCTTTDEGGESKSQTAFARYLDNKYCFRDLDQVFEPAGDYDFSRWGWTNGSFTEGEYVLDIYAGAGQCDIDKGTLVGELTVVYDEGTATITYEMTELSEFDPEVLYKLVKTHLYVGSDVLPSKNGKPTVSPGQYPYPTKGSGIDGKPEYNGDMTTATYVISGLTGDIYVVAHAEVDGFVEEDVEPDDVE